ncbi:MAG: hypothetical protein U0Z26_04260 [Anaerolineales bacterium]
MHTGTGIITEIYLDGSARMDCPPNLIPSPGQYLHAHAATSDSPLPVSLFFYESAPKGFRFTPPLPPSWTIGTKLNLRGPLGHGFVYPAEARKVALIGFDESALRLNGVMSQALKANAEVVLISDSSVGDLPEAIEVQPLRAFAEVCKWADFIAIDIARENLSQLRERFGMLEQVAALREAQVLIRTDVPCGGLAECGVCAVNHRDGWKMTCKDGPVFVLKELQ